MRATTLRERRFKNKDLYKILSLITKKSLAIVADKIKTTPPPIITIGVWQKNDNNFIRRNVKQTVWDFVLHEAMGLISNTKEFKTLLNVIKFDQVISTQINTLVGTCIGRSTFRIENVIPKLTKLFLSDEGIIEFDDSLFTTEYLNIENSLYTKCIKLERITPLCGFYSDTSEILLDDNISIVELSDREIIEALKLGIRIGLSIGDTDLIFNIQKFAIKFSCELQKVTGETVKVDKIDDQHPFVKGIVEDNILSSLRIFKAGKVYPLTTITKSESIFHQGTSYTISKSVKPSSFRTYQLLRNEIEDFVSLWNLISKISLPDKHFLSVAMRRFSQANERERIEDKIIDLAICAEALFLGSGSSSDGELSYRLSHRAAMFIEEKAEKQKVIFKFMKDAYDVRSRIVHGDALKLPKKEDGSECSLPEFSDVLEDYLRLSIKKMLNLLADTSSPIKKIDWTSIIFPTVR